LDEPKNPSGVFNKNIQNQKPDIRNVQSSDLKSFGRVEQLYFQACQQGLVQATEASAINFLSAAARATSVAGDPARIFMGIVRRRLWNYITQAEEFRALGALRKYRADNPDRFRLVA